MSNYYLKQMDEKEIVARIKRLENELKRRKNDPSYVKDAVRQSCPRHYIMADEKRPLEIRDIVNGTEEKYQTFEYDSLGREKGTTYFVGSEGEKPVIITTSYSKEGFELERKACEGDRIVSHNKFNYDHGMLVKKLELINGTQEIIEEMKYDENKRPVKKENSEFGSKSVTTYEYQGGKDSECTLEMIGQAITEFACTIQRKSPEILINLDVEYTKLKDWKRGPREGNDSNGIYFFSRLDGNGNQGDIVYIGKADQKSGLGLGQETQNKWDEFSRKPKWKEDNFDKDQLTLKLIPVNCTGKKSYIISAFEAFCQVEYFKNTGRLPIFNDSFGGMATRRN